MSFVYLCSSFSFASYHASSASSSPFFSFLRTHLCVMCVGRPCDIPSVWVAPCVGRAGS